MLGKEQLNQYEEAGYIIPDLQLPEAMLEDIRARHTRFVAKYPEYRDYCPALLHLDDGFVEYCRQPEILDMVEQILGPDFALWNSSFFAKPALDGRATPWHQDGEYWPIRPLATCTVWLAVDDSTTENGCLRVLKGSHKDRRLRRHNQNDSPDLTLNQELDPSEYDESQAVDIELKAGQMSLHDIYLLHGSEANRSPRPRRGMTMRFMPTTSEFDRGLATELSKKMNITDHAVRPVYLMRGTDQTGRNIFANA